MPISTEKTVRCWPAPAKLNLFLHITGRGEDGYHHLQTLFQMLDWGDEIRFFLNEEGRISRSCNIDGIPENEDICVKAANLLQTRHGVKQGVHIDLIKRIPMGAGLGGGSSDAATVLVALNELWRCGNNVQQLAGLGLELGADVPVFIHGHSALAEGRGEKLHSVALGERYYVLVFPGISISTAAVFQYPLLTRDSIPIDLSHVVLNPGRNDCEAAALEMFPELKSLLSDLNKWGQARMSGTGSTFFLQFESKKAANKAASVLKCRYTVRAVRGLDRSQLLDNLSVE